MFIPGAYHVRVAILAYRKVPGYSFDDIPEFEQYNNILCVNNV